jgi:hypothetical protein
MAEPSGTQNSCVQLSPGAVHLAAAAVVAVLVDEPHARVDQVVRALVAVGHGVVVEGPVLRVAEPALLFQDDLVRARSPGRCGSAGSAAWHGTCVELAPVLSGNQSPRHAISMPTILVQALLATQVP